MEQSVWDQRRQFSKLRAMSVLGLQTGEREGRAQMHAPRRARAVCHATALNFDLDLTTSPYILENWQLRPPAMGQVGAWPYASSHTHM